MAFNAKDERIRKLWERGMRDPKLIARKLGFSGEATSKGIARVHEGIERLKLK